MISDKIREIWTRELGTADFTDEDDFFDLGGTSVVMFRVQHGIGQELGVELAMDQLYRCPTVAGLAKHVEFLTAAS